VPSVRFGATRRSSKSALRSGGLDRALTSAAVAYFAAVIAITILVRSGDLSASEIDSSADGLVDGRVLRLLSSGITVAGPLAVWQILLCAFVAAVVIQREGAAVWWVAALAGHVGSALISYAIIGLAWGLDSGSAEDAANDPDYGISAVLGASLGALFASGLRAGDRMITGFGIAGFVGLLPFSVGWLDIEHPLAFGLGAAVVLRVGSTDPSALRRQR
jgi:hypothetical protein